jgi:hypothetical protein
MIPRCEHNFGTPQASRLVVYDARNERAIVELGVEHNHWIWRPAGCANSVSNGEAVFWTSPREACGVPQIGSHLQTRFSGTRTDF